MSEQPFERLAYENRFVRTLSQQTDGTDCFVPFVSLNEDENTIILKLTADKTKRMLSALMNGADITYPDDGMQIVVDFLAGIHCEQQLNPDESGCVEYSPSVPFVKFFPDNPYVSGDTSSGWNKEAWFRWNQFDTLFPDWIDNWLGGIIDSITGYQTGDILFNIESIPVNPIDAFLSGGGLLPKIEIRFSGTGTVEIELLSFPLGGKAIVELDSEPNVLDILTGGLIDPAAFLVELARDVVNFPPDEYPIINVEIPVETAGDHVLYIVYIPILNDELIPVGFGGGFRGLELCGFEEQGSAGVESIVWDGCALKSITGGIETTIVTAAEIQACLDLPEPEPSGGGIGNAIKVRTLQVGTGSPITWTNTAYATIWTPFSHTPSYSKMLVIASNLGMSSSAVAGTVDVALLVGGNAGLQATRARVTGQPLREMQVSDTWENLTPGVSVVIGFQGRVSGNTGRLSEQSEVNFTIIEYDDIADLFVEDIRISGEELQKKIGGVWITVPDSLKTILDTIQSDVLNAASVASSAYSLATGAVSVNTSQQAQINSIISVNNTQNSRLSDLELDAAAQALTLATHTSQIASLQQITGILSFGDVWATNHDLNSSPYFWTMLVGSGYVSGQGFRSNTNGLTLSLSDARLAQNQVTHVFARIIMNSSPTGTLQWRVNGSAYGSLRYTGVGGPSDGWLRVPNVVGTTFQIEFLGFGDFYLRNLYFLGRGSSNPFV